MTTDLERAQERYCTMLGLLLSRATFLAIPLRLGCGWCQEDHHMENSLHKIKLAHDFVIMWEDDAYGSFDDYLPLGLYWESIGGYWGGRRNAGADGRGNDANHFSLAYSGRK